MTPPRSFLVFHTAFPGDIILVLPLIQVLRRTLPGVPVSVVTTPAAAGLLAGHPAVKEVIVYDKRGDQKGLRGIQSMASILRKRRFDAALVPHRSFRSGLVCRLAGIPVRIGFSTSAARCLMTETVPYVREDHEIIRNLSLAGPLGIRERQIELPSLFPSREDRSFVDSFLGEGIGRSAEIVAVAPGSVWNTKRWPESRFAALVGMLQRDGHPVVLVGGEEDVPLCGRIKESGGFPGGVLLNASGKFTLLQSAALIERCTLLVSNDSAPMHLGVAMRTPVVALFGATVPAFGFAPVGEHDRVVELNGLTCRPCAIHGGHTCPIGTFECMNGITSAQVRKEVVSVIASRRN